MKTINYSHCLLGVIICCDILACIFYPVGQRFQNLTFLSTITQITQSCLSANLYNECTRTYASHCLSNFNFVENEMPTNPTQLGKIITSMLYMFWHNAKSSELILSTYSHNCIMNAQEHIPPTVYLLYSLTLSFCFSLLMSAYIFFVTRPSPLRWRTPLSIRDLPMTSLTSFILAGISSL